MGIKARVCACVCVCVCACVCVCVCACATACAETHRKQDLWKVYSFAATNSIAYTLFPQMKHCSGKPEPIIYVD